MNEKEFPESYDDGEYRRPSVTADILVFSMSSDFKLQLLLVKRKNQPHMGKWAIPGGFVDYDESLEEAALRELKEETHVEDVYLEQLYTFGKPGRDPRTRVISVAYVALVPKERLHIQAGDDAAEAALFEIENIDWGIRFYSPEMREALSEEDLAFDHAEIIRTALKRLAGKLDYTDIAFQMLENKRCFTAYEFEKIYEAISGRKVEKSNFRRDFIGRYIKTGVIEELDVKSSRYSIKPATCYCYKRQSHRA